MGTRKTIYFSEETEAQVQEILEVLQARHKPIRVSLSQAIAVAVAEYRATLAEEPWIDPEPSHE